MAGCWACWGSVYEANNETTKVPTLYRLHRDKDVAVRMKGIRCSRLSIPLRVNSDSKRPHEHESSTGAADGTSKRMRHKSCIQKIIKVGYNPFEGPLKRQISFITYFVKSMKAMIKG